MRVAVALLLVACRENFDDTRRDAMTAAGDHDGDGKPDATDNCPAHFNETQADGDGDGVGDVCDPHVAQPGDKLFNASLFSSGFGVWSPSTATDWTVADGVIATTASEDATNARLTAGTPAATPTLVVGYSVIAYGPAMVVGENNIQITLTLDNGENWSCATHNESTDPRMSHAYLQTPGAGFRFRSLTTLMNEGTRAQAALTRESDVAFCRADDVTPTEPTAATTPRATNASIQVLGARVALSYALIYGVP